MKRYIALFTAVLLIMTGLTGVFEIHANSSKLPFEVERFSDVPENHWAYENIHYFRHLNIAQGKGNNRFGLGQTIKRSEFIAMLVRLMGWETVEAENSSFSDVGRDKWYYSYVETAAAHGAISKEEGSFRPDENITRLEIAEAIVRALGYEGLARQLVHLPAEFADVSKGSEYANIVKAFGISNGADGVSFLPDNTAKKEEAIAMLMRMYERMNSKVEELHAFYAIKSYDQIDKIPELDSVSFGWSRLEYDGSKNSLSVSVAKDGKSDFFIPSGYSEPLNIAKQNGLPVQLNLFASNDTKVPDLSGTAQVGIIERLLTDDGAQKDVIDQIIQALDNTQVDSTAITFDGIVVDFENLRGEKLRSLYSEFLSKLKAELAKHGKRLYVAVHPKRDGGQAYFDGYDYKAIGEIADRVILMAHDYNAVSLTDDEMAMGYNDTPLTPINEIYTALKAITDKDTGVADRDKIWLQLSFDIVQWKMAEGKVINKNAFRPSYSQLRERMTKNEPEAKLSINYSERLQNPWVTYYNTNDGTNNIIWYEDSRSVNAKIQLAKMFGVKGISLWRLGTIPDFEEPEGGRIELNVWQTIKEQME